MNEYVAREVGGLWAVATSTQVICNYLSEDLAIAAVNEMLGLSLTQLETSLPSIFIATFQSALAETAARLQKDDSIEGLRKETQTEIELLKDQLKGESLKRQLAEAKEAFNSFKERLMHALNDDPLTRKDAALTALAYMARSPEKKRINELEGKICCLPL